MTLNITYELTLKSDAIVVDTPKVLSNSDSMQVTTKYSSNLVPNVNTKRLDLILQENAPINGDASKEVTINLQELEVNEIKIIHLKSIKNFYYKFSQTEEELNNIPYDRCKIFFKDYGDIISSETYTPPQPIPKYVRFLNPNNLNTGPITISLILITSYQD